MFRRGRRGRPACGTTRAKPVDQRHLTRPRDEELSPTHLHNIAPLRHAFDVGANDLEEGAHVSEVTEVSHEKKQPFPQRETTAR